MRRSRFIGLEIAGFPATELEFEHAGRKLWLYTVSRLEEHVDRERLLRDEVIPDPPYWAHLWVGARALGRFLSASVELSGRRVLDLGCGLGLTGLVAAAAGAEVWFVDRQPAALDFVRASAARNALTRVRLETLDFTTGRLDARFDAILGAEIVYDPAAYGPLAGFVDSHLTAAGTLYVTDAFRSDASRFFDDLRARGFRGEREAVREWEDGRWQGVFLWSFRR